MAVNEGLFLIVVLIQILLEFGFEAYCASYAALPTCTRVAYSLEDSVGVG